MISKKRIETLSLPSWKEVQKFDCYKVIKFMGKNGEDYGLCIDNGTYNKRFQGWCGIDVDGNCEIVEPLTKKNYIDACKLCKRLFLGDE